MLPSPLVAIAILASSLVLAPPPALGAVKLDCPTGTSVGSICMAYGVITGSFTYGSPAAASCMAYLIQRTPYYISVEANGDVLFPEQPINYRCTQPELQQRLREKLLSGLRVRVQSSLPNGGANGPFSGAWTLAGGGQWLAPTDVTLGPKPVSCSMGPPLTFDFGALPPGPVQAEMSLPFPINCTGKTTGTLTLRNSPKSVIKVGNSGLVAGISANNNPLGSKIQFSKGVTNVTIRAVLSGNTTSVGVQTGSGVLVLEVP